MFESNEELFAEVTRITENQAPEFQYTLNYTVKNAVDPAITELVNFITSEEITFSTFSRS
jgi:hypothetical protein